MWDGIVPPLARSFRVLTYDRRGHSRSGRPPSQGSIHEDVRDLGALIEHLDLAPAHIIGSSFGGIIVLRLAAARPESFRTLSVHEPPLFGLFQGSTGGSAVQSGRETIRAVVDLLERGEMETAAHGPCRRRSGGLSSVRGHVPQVSHPEEYVQAIVSFARHAELGEPEGR